MRPISVVVSGVAASNAIPLDIHKKPFAVSLAAKVSATATYTVQYCFENVLAGETPAWVDHPNLTAQAASADDNLAFPATAVRINVTASTGTVTFIVIQAGI